MMIIIAVAVSINSSGNIKRNSSNIGRNIEILLIILLAVVVLVKIVI